MENMNEHELLTKERTHRLLGFSIILFLALGAWAFFLQNISLDPKFINVAVLLSGCTLLFTLIDIKIGMIFVVFSIALSPEMTVMGTGNIRFEDFLMPVLIFSWFTRSTHEREEFVYTSFKGPLVGFLVVSVLAAFWGYWINPAYSPQTAFFEIGKLVEYYFFFLVMANNLKTEEDIILLITILILASLAGGLFGIRQHATQGWVEGPSGETANIWAGYYVFNLSVVVGLLFSNINVTINLILIVATAVLFWPFLYTFSRTSYIAFVAGMLAIGFLRRQRILLAFILFFLLIALMSNTEVSNRASTILDVFGPDAPSSYEARVQGWEGWMENFKNSPLLGFGPGAVGRDVDNEFVKDLCDRGIFGLLFFVWFLIRVLKLSFRTLTLCRDHPVFSGYLVGFLGGTIALIIHAFGASSFTTIRTMEIFMIALGIMVAIRHLQEQRLEKEKEREDWLKQQLEATPV